MLRLRSCFGFTTASGELKTIFTSVLIAQIATLLACGIYVSTQLKWKLIPSFPETIRFLQDQHHFIILSALVSIGVLLCVFLIKKTNGWCWYDLGISKPYTGKLQTVYILVAAITLMEVFYIGWGQVINEFGGNEKFKTFASVPAAWKLFYLFWLVTIVPLLEELLFRGAIQKVISQVAGIRTGLVFQAVIFAAMHDSYLNYIPIFVFGIVLGVVYVRTKSVWLPAIIHSSTNFLTLIVAAYRA